MYDWKKLIGIQVSYFDNVKNAMIYTKIKKIIIDYESIFWETNDGTLLDAKMANISWKLGY